MTRIAERAIPDDSSGSGLLARVALAAANATEMRFNLGSRKLSGMHSLDTLPKLEPHGFGIKRTSMIFGKPAQRQANPAVDIKVVGVDDADLKRFRRYPDNDAAKAAFRRAQDARLGGEILLGYLKDEAVTTTGWFRVSMLRFRDILTLLEARGQGLASTLIRCKSTQSVNGIRFVSL